jgi:phage shock protein PspC (stress-responsive transcriptional regulator)
VDVAYVRIGFLLFCLLPGPAVVFYLAAWLVLPNQNGAIALESFLEKRANRL